ncbi:hypothetical protein GCK72_021402 [Caenorhabditis remanei]|uniref:F-box domain-containing protein n=1 Tax=Caenorhabditis remanei TaxID=31234 RepID=A0A6A5GI21_CAERE|nr:hypothetical protein GCK72_021402 [Caenorhabditis remanei]KAF1754837.1 hypothetical protein GCK72_021402 [Caenorhabditis remanei]
MNDDVPLLKLPDVAMNRVLHHCEYPDFARLRKTCRSLREFVDTKKPDARMYRVDISCDANRVIFRLRGVGNDILILYKNDEGGCFPRRFTGSEDNLTSNGLDGKDYIEMFQNDFTVFLRHQRSIMYQMAFYSDGETADIEQVLDALKAHAENLKTRKLQLKTTKLTLIGLSAPQILLALSSVHAQSLRSLSISIRGENVLLDEMTETEQWRQLDTCMSDRFHISDIRRISHLRKFSGFVTSVTAADLDFLKAVFINSSNFSYCIMNCNSVADLSEITEMFGVQPFKHDYISGLVSRRWFFHMANDKSRIISLDVRSDDYVEFEQQDIAVVPNDAVIIG